MDSDNKSKANKFNTLNSFKNNRIKSVKSKIAIDFDNEKQAKIVFESVLLEFKTSPNYRSKMSIELENSSIIIVSESNDSTSFRASINSAIKWMKLSLEIEKLVNDK